MEYNKVKNNCKRYETKNVNNGKEELWTIKNKKHLPEFRIFANLILFSDCIFKFVIKDYAVQLPYKILLTLHSSVAKCS